MYKVLGWNIPEETNEETNSAHRLLECLLGTETW